MSGTYPDFQSSYTLEEMVEHFLLTPADLTLVLACRGHVNRCGMALLLKNIVRQNDRTRCRLYGPER